MTIAELFLKIGIQGADTTGKALGGVTKKMDEIREASLLTKAAIAGVVIGFERLTGFASQAGMDLYKFNTVTGLSTDKLQEWQYAAMRFDVTGEEVSSTIKGIQSAMTSMKLTGNAPSGLGLLAAKVGFDTKRIDDTFYVLSKVQQFVKTAPISLANEVAKSFGLSENMIQMLRVADLAKDKLSKTDVISKDEIGRLVEINKLWKDFWFGLRTIGIKAVAKDGKIIVEELYNAFKLLRDAYRFVDDLVSKFSELKLVIVAIGLVLGAAFAPITTAIAGVTYLLSQIEKYRSGDEKKALEYEAQHPGQKVMTPRQDTFADKFIQGAEAFFGSMFKRTPGLEPAKTIMSGPRLPIPFGGADLKDAQGKAVPGASGGVSPNVTIHNYGVEHPQETGEETQRSIARAYRQIAAQVGG